MRLQTTTSNRSDLVMAFISDIHLAHPRTSTYHIIQNLRKAFPDDEATGKLDILFFAGDVFDRLMNLPQDEVDAIQEWIGDVLRICAKRNILVRVLEGTPSHDWRQSKQFVNVNNTLDKPANLKYVDTLSVEVISELNNLSVLYVPDEWNADASVTLQQAKELLSIHGMEQVDVACMHGSFDYQLPIESVKNHNSEAYLAMVRHFIGIGHVHIRSDRSMPAYKSIILAQGSFDRLSHGEEAAKGHYRACISSVGNYHWFVENTGARIYKTLDCREMSVDETIEMLEHYEEYPDESCFRLVIKRNSTVQHGMRDLRKRFPQFKLTTQMDDLKAQEEVNLVQPQVKAVKPISITPTNIVHLVSERLKRRYAEDDPRAQKVLKVLVKHKEAL
ncbi:putative nuclease SbcCD, subunit D [Pseudomonas phage pPa_SNUABM_DT01]|nr:putative nuclease SbcCD, subunit D [Pseudomonas phage pPa_SNUABM_DT01]